MQNCVGSFAGGAYATESNLALKNTRWINNTGVNGGALAITNVGQLLLQGTNQFLNNSASISGGALYLNTSGVILTGNEKFDGNSVRGSRSGLGANIYADLSSFIVVPPSGWVPPFSEGTKGPLPVLYVDANANCLGIPACNGSITNPFNQFQTALEMTNAFGGRIYLRPGIYSGSANVNQFLNNQETTTILPWPNQPGQVIFDCMNEFFGFIAIDGYFNIADVTIQNCTTTSTEGGGALFSNNSYIDLTNVNFFSNSAPNGSGGAIYLYNSAVNIVGGVFKNNVNSGGGGAITMEVSLLSIANGTLFVDNLRYEYGMKVEDNLDCVNSSVSSDRSIALQLGQGALAACSDSFQSKSTVAVFPGSLDTLLFPKNASGHIQSNIFAAVDFDSIVELDSSGTPINSTRLTKSDLTWGVQINNNSAQGNYEVRYNAFGPKVQFLSIIHNFFYVNGTYPPFGGGGGGPGWGGLSIFVQEGTIKTTIEIALWPFQSPSNSLLLTLFANSHLPITFFDQKPVANGTSFTIKTELTTISFGTLDFGVYDDLTKVGPVRVSVSRLPECVSFGFQFSFFELWAAYDPSFGVTLGGTGGGDGEDGGDGDGAPSSVLLGLSIGLPVGALVFTIVGILAIFGIIFGVRRYQRYRWDAKVNVVNWSADENHIHMAPYKIMHDEDT